MKQRNRRLRRFHRLEEKHFQSAKSAQSAVAFFCFMAMAILCVSSFAHADDFSDNVDLTPLRTIAAQDRQTIKTLDSYARQTLTTITGHGSLDGHDALFSVLDITFHPTEYADRNLIRIVNVPLRKEFQRLPSISPEEGERIVHDGTISLNLWSQPAVQQMLSDVMASDTRKAGALQQASDAAEMMGELCRNPDAFLPVAVIPPATGNADDPLWHHLGEVAGNSSVWIKLGQLSGHPTPPPLASYTADKIDPCVSAAFTLLEGWNNHDAKAVNTAAVAIASALAQVNPAVYPSELKRNVEVTYNHLAKMTLPGAAFYFLAFVFFLMSAQSSVSRLQLWGLRFLIVGFAIHTLGIAVRWWLVGSIPIKNEFESVMFSAWFGVAVGLTLELYRGRGIFGAGASFVGWLSLGAIFCVPYVFGRDIGGEIGQVNGVLMSYWLYIHVTSVTASYSLIGTSFLLSIWWLIRYYRSQAELRDTPGYRLSADVADTDLRPGMAGAAVLHRTVLQSLAALLFVPIPAKKSAAIPQLIPAERHRTFLANLDACNLVVLQLAFWILGMGIVFGAIWADESWGRPWGWDPKETFALVTWIVYLIVVHVRVATEDKAWWTAVLSLVGFFIMLFNWIGVNFFLVGLHSYA
jgi:cytochrome c-type biogenesis protein CcsB